MKNVPQQRMRLSASEARDLAEAALGKVGFDAEEARIIGDHMIDAALCGYEYSGLPKILNILDGRRFQQPRTPMRVVRETSVSVLFDGGNNLGMVTMYRAAEASIAKADEHGLAVVGVRNTWLSGRGAHYVEMIARAGLIGIHTVSANLRVAPPDGTAVATGTNPIAFGFPTLDEPLIIDFGTSALSFSDLLLRERRGELLPEGVAIDPQGKPTRDPALGHLGALLPFGGYKGFALALAMQALGVFAGSQDDVENIDGYLIIAMKPDLLVPLDEYRQYLSKSIKRIKATPRQPGVDAIRIPSERAFRERARSLREGVEIDREIYDALLALPDTAQKSHQKRAG